MFTLHDFLMHVFVNNHCIHTFITFGCSSPSYTILQPSLPQTFLCSFQQQFANFVFLLRVFLLKLSYGILSQCQSAPLVTRLSLTRFEASGTANNGEKELSESNSRTISTLMLLSCIQNVSTTYCFSDFHSFPTFPPLILRGCHINHAIVSHLRMFTREVFDFNLALEEETEESSAVASLSFPHLIFS